MDEPSHDLKVHWARLLRDVADSGIEFDDARLGYVVVQIDRGTWDRVSAYRSSKWPENSA